MQACYTSAHARSDCDEGDHSCIECPHGFHIIIKHVKDHADRPKDGYDYDCKNNRAHRPSRACRRINHAEFQHQPAVDQEKFRGHRPAENLSRQKQQENIDNHADETDPAHVNRRFPGKLPESGDCHCDSADSQHRCNGQQNSGKSANSIDIRSRPITHRPESQIGYAAEDQNHLSGQYCSHDYYPLSLLTSGSMIPQSSANNRYC